MVRRRFILSGAIAAVLLAVGIVGVTQHVPDPLDDYRSLRRRAEARGQMPTAVRGQVIAVRDGLFQLESEILFPQRLWVLSRSNREVAVGERVAVQGTLFARGTRGVHKALLPDEIEPELCREGLLVADTLTIYQGRMHG
jgi:hypothetical protein